MNPAEQGFIAVNQAGYRSQDAKVAIFAGTGGRFRLVDAAHGAAVWEGETQPPFADEASGLTISRGDFSAWMRPGAYRIETADGRLSPAFVIADPVYREAHRALLKAFYFFRCGMDLEPSYAGPWQHAACHLSHAVVHGDEGRRIDARGGWHDAGDYGKYVVPGAKAVADLLLAFESYPRAFDRAVPLPETDGVLPDVLHEVRYELEWMLRMQDAESGGAYHKVTTLQFPPLDAMPEADAAELYLSPISATATGCLAGAMAMAARVYAPYEASFASRCLQAAERAWAWLERHPDAPGFRNPPDVATGEYGDRQDADERYWAAAELYRTTGEQRYREAARLLLERETFDLCELGWADVGGYGTLALLLTERDRGAEWKEPLKAAWLRRAEELADIAAADGFGISLRPERYIWGSNMLVMNHAMHLLLADRLTGNNDYEQLAAQHVHYLFGANALGISYVTGFGTRSVRHPHHRPSAGDGVEAPVPGLVSGGPNRGLQDEYAREHLAGRAPAASFADAVESYATNEVAIYWNSPAVFAVSRFAE